MEDIYTLEELEKLKAYLLYRAAPSVRDDLENFMEQYRNIQSGYDQINQYKKELDRKEKELKKLAHPLINGLVHLCQKLLKTKYTKQLYNYLWECFKDGTL